MHRAYDEAFRAAAARGLLRSMAVPEGCAVNGHMYYVRFRSGAERDRVQAALGAQGIEALTHYVPLHLSPMGAALGYRPGDLPESLGAYETLLRLPIHERMSEDQAYGVAERLLEAVSA